MTEDRYASENYNVYFEQAFEKEHEHYYQVHLFSYNYIYSEYFNPEIYTLEYVSEFANAFLSKIRLNSGKIEINMYEHEGVFLIFHGKEFFETVELCEYKEINQSFRFEPSELTESFYDYVGRQSVKTAIENALKSVGANRILPLLEPHITKIENEQIRLNNYFAELREQDTLNPKIRVEVFKLNKKLEPEKINEFLVSSEESAICLPEIRFYENRDDHVVITKDMETGKSIGGIRLNEEIEKRRGVL